MNTTLWLPTVQAERLEDRKEWSALFELQDSKELLSASAQIVIWHQTGLNEMNFLTSSAFSGFKDFTDGDFYHCAAQAILLTLSYWLVSLVGFSLFLERLHCIPLISCPLRSLRKSSQAQSKTCQAGSSKLCIAP